MEEKKYINIDNMINCLYGILIDARDGILDDVLLDRAWDMAWDFNADMKKYLHLKDHSICGNFNNIDYDYPHYITGEFEYNHPMVNAMIKRLDDRDDSERANDDRSFLTEWFFETFGTWGGYRITSRVKSQKFFMLNLKVRNFKINQI